MSYGAYNSDSYNSCVWRLADEEYYGFSNTNEKRELLLGFSISSGNVDVGEDLSIIINKNPSNAWLSDVSDFSYAASNSTVSVDGHTLTAVSAGNVVITATHKLTGLRHSFSVKIFPGTFEVYICASPIIPSFTITGTENAPGHAWIEVVSNSAHIYDVGRYELASEECVTIGKWMSVWNILLPVDVEFEGIWYNREWYKRTEDEKYEEFVYMSTTASKNEIDEISTLIESTYDEYDVVIQNCVHFAVEAWNICASSNKQISQYGQVLPNELALVIAILRDSDEIATFDIPEDFWCGYYNGTRLVEI